MNKVNKTSTKSIPVNNKRKPKKTTKAGRIAIRVVKALVTLMLICVITGCIVVGAVAIYVMEFVPAYPINLSDAKLKFTSTVYANDPSTGNPVETAELSGEENRIWVDLKDTPKDLSNAIISTEDQRFYEHEGVDVKRTIGAFANLIFHYNPSKFGGSTITEQTVKQLAGNVTNRTISVKIREIITALDIEKQYTKDQILVTYINTIPLGNNCYGVQTAANLYFGKEVKDLDLAQCALLAGIIQSPNGDEPYNNAKKAEDREDYVLRNMLDQKMITNDQYTAAVKEKLTFVPKKQTPRSWFTDQVITDVTNDLMTQKGYSKAYAQNMIFTQGLKIYTTENLTIQSYMDQVYTSASYKKLFKGGSGDYFQSGMMIVDYSGRIMGLEGAQGTKSGNMVLNRTQTYRQPGSSIKPIAVYAPAIDAGLIDWSSMFLDDWVQMLHGGQWPHDDEAWTGQNMTVDKALTESRNTVAVRVEQLVKPINSFKFLTDKLGFLKYDPNNKTATKNGLKQSVDGTELGVAIGMGTGVTVEEMAGAYEIFGDGGVFTKPHSYTEVVDADGNVILQNKPASEQVISPDTATIMNQLMQNVVNQADGTGVDARLSNCPVAGKTGTTSVNYDRWWVGETPEYVGAVWTGYDIDKNMGKISNPAVAIWKSVFNKVEQSRDKKKYFPVSGNVVKEPYDTTTGALTVAGTAVGWYSTDDQAVQNMQTEVPSDNSSSSSDNAVSPASSSSGNSSDTSSGVSSDTSSNTSSDSASSTPSKSSSSSSSSPHKTPHK